MCSSDLDVREAFRIHRSGGATSVALQGLTLQVEEGEIVVVLGPSGSGKTTLLRTVGGFDTLSAGTARVLGARDYFVGTRRFSSSVQFRTMFRRPEAESSLTMTNHCPSALTS